MIYCNLKTYCCGGKEDVLFTFVPDEQAVEGLTIELHGRRWYVDEVFPNMRIDKEIEDGTEDRG